MPARRGAVLDRTGNISPFLKQSTEQYSIHATELFPAVLSRAAGSGANRASLPVITPQHGTPASCEVTNIAGSPVYDLTGDLNTEYELTAGKVGSSVNILSGGRLIVDDNANAEAVTVNAGGFMSVTSGGTATRIRENGGYVYIGRRDIPSDIFVPNEFSGLTLDGGWTTIHSGTTATDTTLVNGGQLYVYGGSAKGTTVNSGGALYVYSGGSTSQTTVNPGGQFFVYSGGTATQIVENGGYVNVDPSAAVEFASHEFSGVVYNDQFGRATIHSGTTGTDLTFTSDAQGLYVCSGGIAKNIDIDAFACPAARSASSWIS